MPIQTVFIRHNLDSNPATLEYLWKERLIAIHFESIRSTNPQDYGPAGKQALKRLWRYCESGAIVGAAFRSIRPNQMIVGEIEKGSKVEVLELAKDPNHNDYVYKVVRLKNACEISYLDHPLLAAIQPRQGTLTGWPSAETYLQAVLGKHKISWSVTSLHPSQLEVICYEFLKMRGTLKALLLPIGRGLMDVDIYGIDANGKSILAQVTHSTDGKAIKGKLDRLKEYKSRRAKLIFFGPTSSRFDDLSVHYISVEEVFNTLCADGTDPIYRRVISRMLKR